MSFRDGYQGDTNLSDLNFIGDFPVDHMIGGFGQATVAGGTVNSYVLNLTPPVLSYRPGLLLAVSFPSTNSGAIGINVNGLGVKTVKKVSDGTLSTLDPNFVAPNIIYMLAYDGTSFQVLNSSLTVPDASETTKGVAKKASDTDLAAGDDDSNFVTSLKLKTLLNNRIKPMRAQIRFYSDSLIDTEYGTTGSAAPNYGVIFVKGIPDGAVIKQVTLIWECTLRNTAASQNWFSAGHMQLSSGGPYTNFISLTIIPKLDANQTTPFQFVSHDVSSLVHGNGTYIAVMLDATANIPTIAMSGHWVLEVDYTYNIL